jgi:glycosyltransferase involved in cell wall biosynthesis
MPTTRRVYDCHDRFAAFHPQGRRAAALIGETERALVQRADTVLAASRALAHALRALGRDAQLVPNAADVRHFAQDRATPGEIAALPRPLAGYVGELSSWLDLDLVRSLPASGACATVVLIGPASPPLQRRLRACPGVHWLGVRPCDQLPALVQGFDAALIPFVLSPLTEAVSPIKLYEYLAAGCAVVSTPLPEVVPFRGLVEVASASDFPQAVRQAIGSTRDPEARARRRAAAAEHDWTTRVETILALLGASQAPDAHR